MDKVYVLEQNNCCNTKRYYIAIYSNLDSAIEGAKDFMTIKKEFVWHETKNKMIWRTEDDDIILSISERTLDG